LGELSWRVVKKCPRLLEGAVSGLSRGAVLESWESCPGELGELSWRVGGDSLESCEEMSWFFGRSCAGKLGGAVLESREELCR
jgi:hypothetical protein